MRHPVHQYNKSGAYFVTIVAQDRLPYFGEIANNLIQLNAAGEMVRKHWIDLPRRFPGLEIDEFVVMPNHFHGTILLGMTQIREEWVQLDHSSNPKLGNILGAFKSLTTIDYMNGIRTLNWKPFLRKLWQRNYFDRVIRNEREFAYINEYIRTNPIRWNKDSNNVECDGIDEFDQWLMATKEPL